MLLRNKILLVLSLFSATFSFSACGNRSPEITLTLDKATASPQTVFVNFRGDDGISRTDTFQLRAGRQCLEIPTDTSRFHRALVSWQDGQRFRYYCFDGEVWKAVPAARLQPKDRAVFTMDSVRCPFLTDVGGGALQTYNRNLFFVFLAEGTKLDSVTLSGIDSLRRLKNREVVAAVFSPTAGAARKAAAQMGRDVRIISDSIVSVSDLIQMYEISRFPAYLYLDSLGAARRTYHL